MNKYSRMMAVLCLAALAVANPARAGLIFNFSFENDTGDTAGPITGTIVGLVDNAAFQTTGVVTLTGVGDHPEPLGGLPSLALSYGANFISVLDGMITGYNLQSVSFGSCDLTVFGCSLGFLNGAQEQNVNIPINYRSLSCEVVGGCINRGTDANVSILQTGGDGAEVTFTRVPLPATLALLGLGLAGLGISRRKRQIRS